MSFLSDLVEGKSGNLGKDLSNPFDDAGTDFSKQPTWAKDLEIAAPLAIGALATGGLDLTALPGVFGGEAAADAGAAGIAGQTVADATLGGADALGFAGDVGAGTGATVGGDALTGIDTALSTAPGAGGVAGQTLAAPTIASGGWPASLDLAAGGGTDAAGAPLSLGGGATAGATPSGGGVLSSLTSGLKTAAPFVGAAGLGASLYSGYEQKQQLNSLNKQEQANAINAGNIAAQAQSIAAPLLNNGQALTTYLTTGTLPPQFQTQVDQTIASQKAGIIQGYASRGMSTDPKQNSQLQQDLAAVDNSKNELMTSLESTLATAGNQMITTANNLLSQGLSATQLEAQIPIQISQLNQELNQSMSQAISNFAAAINGGGQSGKAITLNVGGGGATG
jgi:hypothetical protein